MDAVATPDVITRFAPSPTGALHLGNIRTALFNWALARQAGGRFVLRLDDTDSARVRPDYVDGIRRDLDWLGLHWDGEVRQSDRLEAYRAAADRLRAAGRLYDAYETAEELALKRRAQLARGRPPVYDRAALALSEADRARLAAERPAHWRFRLDHARVAWDDLILGPQAIDAASLSDPVLIRGDGQVLYTLASVVDDAAMGITHVVRGADHVTNTATQVQLFAALGAGLPRFAHHALLVDAEGAAFSKRLGTLSVAALREGGVEPMAILSLLARLGSADPVVPVADPAQLVAGFDITRFGAAPTRLDPADLTLLGARILRGAETAAVAADLAAAGVPAPLAEGFWHAIRDNVTRRADIAFWWRLCRDGARPVIAPEDADFVAEALALLPPPPWDETTWDRWTRAVRERTGRKGRALYQPLRRALTGQDSGPEMGALMPFLTRVPGVAA